MSIITDYIDAFAAGTITLEELGQRLKDFPWATPQRLAYMHHSSSLEAILHAEDSALDEEPNTWDEVRTARHRDHKLTKDQYLYLVKVVQPA